MTVEELEAYLEKEMLKLLMQSGPIPYNGIGAKKLETCINKAIGKLSRNIREGWYAGKFNGKHIRGTSYALRDHLCGSWKSIRNNR
jgi:hypothetical protein